MSAKLQAHLYSRCPHECNLWSSAWMTEDHHKLFKKRCKGSDPAWIVQIKFLWISKGKQDLQHPGSPSRHTATWKASRWWCHLPGSALINPGNTNQFISHHLNPELLGNGFTPYSLLFQNVVLFPLNLIYSTYFSCWLWHFIPSSNQPQHKDISLSCSSAERQRSHSHQFQLRWIGLSL